MPVVWNFFFWIRASNYIIFFSKLEENRCKSACSELGCVSNTGELH